MGTKLNLLYIIFCICLFGFSTFLRKLALDRMHPYQFQIISGIIYCIFIPIWFYVLPKDKEVNYSAYGIIFAIVGTLIYTLSTVLFSFILKETKNPGSLSALISLSPIITIGLSFIFLGEKFSLTKILALIFAIISAILVSC